MVELGSRRTNRKGAGRKLSAYRLRAPHFYPKHVNCPIQTCSDATAHVGNHMFIAWCKRPGRPEAVSFSGGCNLGV